MRTKDSSSHQDESNAWLVKRGINFARLFNWRTGERFILGKPQAAKETVNKILPSLNNVFGPYSEGEIIDYSYSGPELRRMMVHVTSQCNLMCRHCYLGDRNDSDMSFEEIKSIVQSASNMGVDEIYITGGEPFLFSGFNNLLALLIRKKIFLAGIYTNGVLMCSNRHIIEKIAKEYRTTFYISLDGLNDGHLKLRGLDKSFQETIHAIEFLNDLGIAIVINTVISELQASSAIELYSLLVKYKILRWRVDVQFPMGSAITHWSELQLSPERELLIYQQILEMWLLDNMPFDLELGHYFRYINGHIRTIEYSQNSFVCGYNRDSIVIWPAGEVTACSRVVPDSSWGNVKETKLNTIWESQYIRAMKDKRVRDFPKCRSCDHYKYCGGGCPAENNMDLASNLDEPSSVCNLFRGGYFKEFSQMLNRLQKKHCVNLFTQP